MFLPVNRTDWIDHYAQAVCIQDWFPKPHSPLKRIRRKTKLYNVEELAYS